MRGGKELKEVSISVPHKDINTAAVSGLRNAIRLLEDVCNGKCHYDLMEIMVCPDGCVNGGGQPISSCPDCVKARSKSIYELDKSDAIRVAHKNSAVNKMYEKFAHEPGSPESREKFLARFEEKKVLK
jgi:iron only hydrogenase large subunit-like protein